MTICASLVHVPEQYLRLVHNLSDREYDYGRMKHQLLSEAEIRSVQHYAVYDSLKKYVFIGGCNQGDGMLRCPAAGGRANVDLEIGSLVEEHLDGTHGKVVRDDIWDNSLPAEKACEHYLINPQSATSGANWSGAPGEQAGASPVRWSPPPQGVRARNVRANDNGNRSEGAAGGEPQRAQEQSDGNQSVSAPAGFCFSGDIGRSRAAGSSEGDQGQALPSPLRIASSNASSAFTQEVGAVLESGETDIFGHVSLGQSSTEAAGRTIRSGRRDNACLSTRRVQEGSERARRDERSSDKSTVKEKDQGLISRILHVFMRETPDSTYRSRLNALRRHSALLPPPPLTLIRSLRNAIPVYGAMAQVLVGVVRGSFPPWLRRSVSSPHGARRAPPALG